MRIKEDPVLVVTNLHLGAIPVRLFQPKAASPNPRRGIIFFHRVGALMGSLGKILHGGFIKEEPHPHTQLCPPPLPWEPCWRFFKKSQMGCHFLLQKEIGSWRYLLGVQTMDFGLKSADGVEMFFFIL